MCLENNTCYRFEWYTDGIQIMKQNTVVAKIEDIKIFQFLFDAVEVVFPPIYSDDFGMLFSYKKYLDIYVHEQYKTTGNIMRGLSVRSEDLVNIISRENIYKCSNNTFLSYLYVCDGNHDCPGDIIQDEYGCKCNDTDHFTRTCKYVIINAEEMICSRFYYHGRYGDCHMYLTSTIGHDIFITINDTTKVEQFTCSNKELPSCAVRDICTYTLNKKWRHLPM